MALSTLAYFIYLAPIALSLGVILGGVFYKKLQPSHRMLWLYLIVCLAIDLVARLVATVAFNNLVLFILFGALELGILGIFYARVLNKKLLPLLLISGGFIFALTELILLNSSDVKTFQSYTKPLADFLIVILAAYTLLQNLHLGSQEKSSLLHVILLSYFSLELIFLLPLNFLVNQASSWVMYMWIGRIIVTFVFYLYLSWELWKNGKTPTRSPYGSY